MFRFFDRVRILTVVAATLACSTSAFAQPWAQKMFKDTEHDFGDVARGAKTEYEFELTNIYKEDIHIAAVKASCGCTEPVITKPFLKTYEKGSILCKFKTKDFFGQRGATVTVTIDKPYYAEVQLKVKGYIRTDVVFEPSAVEFGEVDLGTKSEKKISVTYAGRDNWTIKDVRSANENLEVELANPVRGPGRVTYQMTVRMKGNATEGYFDDEIFLVTDDANRKQIPVAVNGKVASALEMPKSLLVGIVKAGEQTTKVLIVKGKRPFKITDVQCEDPAFSFKVGEESKSLQLINVTYTAGNQAGDFSFPIKVSTDMNMTLETLATVTVKGDGEVLQASQVQDSKPGTDSQVANP
jgi:hypothetical protein